MQLPHAGGRYCKSLQRWHGVQEPWYSFRHGGRVLDPPPEPARLAANGTEAMGISSAARRACQGSCPPGGWSESTTPGQYRKGCANEIGGRRRRDGYRSWFGANPDSVDRPKLHPCASLVPDRPTPSVLEIIRPLVTLPLPFHTLGSGTEKVCGFVFVKHGIIVVDRQRWTLKRGVDRENPRTSRSNGTGRRRNPRVDA